MKEAYYFSHDSNARHDPKITAMRGVYGSEGYGWYWMLIEMMRESEGYKLDMHSKYAFNAFALQLHGDSNRIEEFINDCINEFNLFDADETHFWSASLLRRMEIREQKSEARRKAAKARWDKEKQPSEGNEENAQGMQMHSNADANGMQGKESKGKESKEKLNKRKKDIKPKTSFAEFVTLTQEEYDKLVSSHGEDRVKRMIEILDNYKGQSEKNKKKYTSDYRAILNWVVKRVEEEEQRGGHKGPQTFTGGQATARQYNQNNKSASGANGQSVTVSRNASGNGTGSQNERNTPASSKYDQFVRR